ncbi:c-type cytochrome [Altererythrobacter aerius]|uniref:C-type cytochrome n=1 Tax=Tsuneonella aeria TaxID=1837929 RepID=A0A6I4TFC5_9SPHN|nr:c-type cytochrome [Tsuneonella aeria]
MGAVLVLAGGLVACKPPPQPRHDLDPAAIARGREAVIKAGCAACHAFPDIDWPKGRAGPALTAFDGVGPIAGTLPNTPGNLAAFVRNSPAAKPGSSMPAMPLTPREARDVAEYLYGIADDR